MRIGLNMRTCGSQRIIAAAGGNFMETRSYICGIWFWKSDFVKTGGWRDQRQHRPNKKIGSVKVNVTITVAHPQTGAKRHRHKRYFRRRIGMHQ